MGNLYKQKHYAMLFSNRVSRKIEVRIDLFNENDVQVDSITDVVVSGSINLDGDSSYRRTANMTTKLIKKLLPLKDGQVWFDKRIRISLGLEDWNGEIIWYNLGRFAIENVSASKGTTDKTLNFSLLDYMAFLDGTLGGHISHDTEIKVKSGVNISEAIATTVKSLPRKIVSKLDIEGLEESLVYDLEFSLNSTKYDMIKKMTDLFMAQEFFFDLEGVFRVQRIRDRRFDPIVWDFTEDRMDLTVDYSNDIDMSKVRNSVHVWGKYNDVTGIQHYWVYRNRWARNKKSDLNSLTDKQIGDICHIFEENQSYVWEGAWKPLTFSVATDFNIENIGEKIWSTAQGDSDTLAQTKMRCEYEFLQHNDYGEIINISCLPIYLLNVNTKIKVEDKETGIKGDYLVTSINMPLGIGELMSMTCRKIYY